MTAKQALRERIDALTEEEASELLNRLDWDSTEFETLTPEELDELAQARAEVSAGEQSSGEDVFRRLGL